MTRQLSPCAFLKYDKYNYKTENIKSMLLDNYFDSAIVVDNSKEEGEALANMLKEQDIRTDFVHYGSDSEVPTFKRNRKLVLMDLMLNEDVGQYAENMSIFLVALQKMCGGSSFGQFGLVVWTKHPDYKDELIRRIDDACKPPQTESTRDDEEEDFSDKRLTNLPLFVICLDKTRYISPGNNYSTLKDDLEKALKEDSAAYFYSRWSESVERAKNKTIGDMYGLIGDYQRHSEKLTYILQQLAKQHTGVKNEKDCLITDAYKAFDNLLYADLCCQQKEEGVPNINGEIKCPFTDDKDKEKLSVAINTKFFIDMDNISQEVVIPGNVYQVNVPDSPLRINLEEDYFDGKGMDRRNVKYIAIELTPPCDFSNKKVGSRMIGGIIADISNENISKALKIQKCDKLYQLKGIQIEGTGHKLLLLDFRYLYTPKTEDIKDASKYKILFRAKPQLFADILQKFSSHAARLGLAEFSFVNNEKKK